MLCIYTPNPICFISFKNNRKNIVTENPKTQKILPLYRKYTIVALPNNLELFGGFKKFITA